MSTGDRYAATTVERFVGEKDKIVQRLRDLADAVEQIPTHDRTGENLRDPSAVVSQVTHTVLWGAANLRLDLLSSWAIDVYDAREPK